MIKTQALRRLVVGALAIFLVCLLTVFIPERVDNQLIGFYGHFHNGNYMVSTVIKDSPAALAGIAPGDIIVKRDGIPVKQWRDNYENNWSNYEIRHNQGFFKNISYETRRDANTQVVQIKPRKLSATETLSFYIFRIILIIILITCVVLIINVNSTRFVMLIALCFTISAIWVASGTPYWTTFFSPLVRNTNSFRFYFSEILQIVSLQIVVSSMLHTVLVFPSPRNIFIKQGWIFPFIYIAPLLLILYLLLTNSVELFSEKVISIRYPERLWLNTIFLLFILMALVDVYRKRLSEIQKIQSRFLFTSISIFIFMQLSFWNIPIIFLNRPLIPNYDWLLIPAAIIPVSMFLSISKHQLFGIRLLIRRRIRLIETLLRREKKLVQRRDNYIEVLSNELRKLRIELKKFVSDERINETQAFDSNLPILLEAHPALSRIKTNNLIGESQIWNKVFEDIVLANNVDGPVLIIGESGTGKTDIARAIHLIGNRQNKVYKEISCAQFEHADPAFALGRIFGIGRDHGLPNLPKDGQIGLLLECHGGTLFLDDFDRLPLNVQDLLLYPLENKPFNPGIGVGGAHTADIKYILATNRDPEILVENNALHGDVLARIGIRINVPPLRERMEDIPLLTRHFISLLNEEGDWQIDDISPNTMFYLSNYNYPKGNVRELKNEITLAAGKAFIENDNILRAGYLSKEILTAVNTRHNSGKMEYENGSEINNDSDANSSNHRVSKINIDEPYELKVLRRNKFNIKLCEKELGFSQQSKTFTNYLRGICIKSLSDNNWNINRAATAIVNDNDPKLIAKIERKIGRYITNIQRHIGQNTENALFKKLPASYHKYLTNAIEWVRKFNMNNV